jgi:hypothetical protein
LGHASIRTTQDIYVHLTGAAEKQGANRIDEVFGPVAITAAAKIAKAAGK